jgi:hypothetical protein
MKICSKCKKEKDVGEFAPSKRTIKGTWCRQCHTEYYRKKLNVKSPRVDNNDGTRKCQKCKETKDLELFSKNKKCKLGRERTCKECTNRSRDKNRDKMYLKKKEYYEENRDKILQKYHDTKTLRDKTFKICSDCDEKKPWDDFIKHRKLCRLCHNKKRALWRKNNLEKARAKGKG